MVACRVSPTENVPPQDLATNEAEAEVSLVAVSFMICVPVVRGTLVHLPDWTMRIAEANA